MHPNAPLLPTSQQTIGPFFPRTLFRDGDNDLTRVASGAAPTRQGEPILLRGRVTREGGFPCLNTILEAWQADAGGRFSHPLDPERHLADPDFLGWGRAWTDADGQYEFRTVLPGGYTDTTGRRRGRTLTGCAQLGAAPRRYRGLAETGMRNVATAAALNLDRLAAWFAKRPLASTRVSSFAAMAA